jgi:hypothetical protein
MISDTDILKTAIACEDDLNRLTSELIAKANEAGGADNITLVVAKVTEQDEIEDFDEVRRVTVDWGEEKVILRIADIIEDKFPPEPDSVPEPAVTTAGFKPPRARKSEISPALLVMVALVVIAAILFIFFK